MRLKDTGNPAAVMRSLDLLAFAAVQAAVGGLFLLSLYTLGFEPTVVIILSVMLVQLAQR